MEKREDKTRNKMNMLEGKLLPKMLMFAIPLAISSILQQMFNAVDIAVVGRFAFQPGSGGCWMQFIIDQSVVKFIYWHFHRSECRDRFLYRTGNFKKVKDPFIRLFWWQSSADAFDRNRMPISKPVLTLMGTPEDTLDLAVLYLRIYLLGMPFIMVYNFGASILRQVLQRH